jgi:hypothetical protein
MAFAMGVFVGIFSTLAVVLFIGKKLNDTGRREHFFGDDDH